MSNIPTALTPETLAQQISAAVNAPGERTRALEAQKVEALVAQIVGALVQEVAKQGGVNIGTVNINLGQGRQI